MKITAKNIAIAATAAVGIFMNTAAAAEPFDPVIYCGELSDMAEAFGEYRDTGATFTDLYNLIVENVPSDEWLIPVEVAKAVYTPPHLAPTAIGRLTFAACLEGFNVNNT